MSRFFKFVCALMVVLSVFAFAGSGIVKASDTQTVSSASDHHHHYDLHYGTCSHDLRFHSSYTCPIEAQHMASHLRASGYWTQVYSH
jgi:hypothetical protein